MTDEKDDLGGITYAEMRWVASVIVAAQCMVEPYDGGVGAWSRHVFEKAQAFHAQWDEAVIRDASMG